MEKNLKSKILWLCPFKGVQAWDVRWRGIFWNPASFFIFGALYYTLFPGIFDFALKATVQKNKKNWELVRKNKLI
jgi:hypothetical protein